MNQKQRQYALERVDTIFKQAKIKIEDETLVKGHKISVGDLREKLEDAGFKLRDNYYGKNVRDYIDTSEWDTCDEIDKETRNKRITELTADTQNTKDEIMLGDSKEALEAINNLVEKFDLN